ncbi:MAG: nucleoside phosphorylase [Bacteroidia bacterium]|nr:nucleoside phosphorylase [Bacteroidia bacterium]
MSLTENPIPPSELIINPNGSIYHLGLVPDQLADKIILVGDPERVPKVSKFFSSIEFKMSRREFVIHTGMYQGHRVTVLSTGMGTDNIDIAITELDALVNIDFQTRLLKSNHTQLKILRLGTCGGVQPEVPLGSFVLSEYACGLDGLAYYYCLNSESDEQQLNDSFRQFLQQQFQFDFITPYSVRKTAQFSIAGDHFKGITLTADGFYGPQSRQLRLKPRLDDIPKNISTFRFGELKFLNIEMETAGILLMSRLLGHQAASLSMILANRQLKQFFHDSAPTIDRLIEVGLNSIIQ